MEYENYLAHYGVPGMKWGVRRYVDANGKVTQAGKEHYGYKNDRTGAFAGIKKALSSSSNKLLGGIKGQARLKFGGVKRKISRKKSPSSMSDQELDEQIKRLKKEKEFKQLRDEIDGVKNKNNGGNNGVGKKGNKDAYTLKSALNKVLVSTAVEAATGMAKKQWNLKFNEWSNEGKKRAEAAKEMAKEAAQKVVDKQAFEAFKSTLPTTRSASSLKKNAARLSISDLGRRTSFEIPSSSEGWERTFASNQIARVAAKRRFSQP